MQVGCTSDGKIKSAQVEVFCNGGSTQDLSGAFMEKCLCQIDNAYCIPNWHAVGRVCKTNIRSPTNFRGFGAPQAVFLAEYLIAKVAQVSTSSQQACPCCTDREIRLVRTLQDSQGVIITMLCFGYQ